MNMISLHEIKGLRSKAIIANQVSIASLLEARESESFTDFIDEVICLACQEYSDCFSINENASNEENFARTIFAALEYYNILDGTGIDLESVVSQISDYYSVDDCEDDYSLDEANEHAIDCFVQLVSDEGINLINDIGISSEFEIFVSLAELVKLSKHPNEVASIKCDAINNYVINLTCGTEIQVSSLNANGEVIDLTIGNARIEDIYVNISDNVIPRISLSIESEISMIDYDGVNLNEVLSCRPSELFKNTQFPTVELRHYIKALVSYLDDNNKMILQSHSWLYEAVNELIESDVLLESFVSSVHREAVNKIFELIATTYPVGVSQRFLKAQVEALDEKVLEPEFVSLLYCCDETSFISNADVVEFAKKSNLPLAQTVVLWEQPPLLIEEKPHALSL
ncbi:hypothetical protein GCM10011607_11660 [Shewanella inventionis]|uniref:Uncharacterized protein n=1 Tax=Shewanella inventionis TaxID=1738770 RepID=A0ABQ1IWB3_9GAMM|nr:hypothetical protein [Shewanella inventionis]GGB52827.1 hypothetical protein GCM10011607_11660 [Shewanella inventionis]